MIDQLPILDVTCVTAKRSTVVAEVADRTLSDKAVRNQVSNIFARLQVVDRAQAMVRAREADLGR